MAVLALVSCLAAAGCITVRLIADYDEQIDKGVTAFQKAMESHLTTLESKIGTPDAEYPNYAQFYREIKVDLSALRVRAAAQANNEITVAQVDLLTTNVRLLEEAHKGGLKENDIPPIRSAFNVGATAILKLELAKKRGEK
jgi:hypothetical protein